MTAIESHWESVRLRRKSSETTVTLTLGPARERGEGIEVRLPDALLAHALESFAAWAGLTLVLKGAGGDVHHVVEDAALVLGRGLRRCLGTVPRARIASATVPMDEALVQVALDLVDRPYLTLDGEYPPLLAHFLRSLTHEAKFTLHVRRLAGTELHHVVEATFKALGLAFARASEPRPHPPSRKGEVTWEDGGRW